MMENQKTYKIVSVCETHDETGVTPMGISPGTELKHTNTTNRTYKYKASALQNKITAAKYWYKYKYLQETRSDWKNSHGEKSA